jgi:hypothetical protein
MNLSPISEKGMGFFVSFTTFVLFPSRERGGVRMKRFKWVTDTIRLFPA